MTEEKTRKYTDKCYGCGSPLELVGIDMKKSTRIMLFQSCGLFHYYKKDLLGNYRLTKVSKNPEGGQQRVP